jgi:hypothetical protein
MTDLAKLVKPLEFEERRNNMWGAQFGYEIGWNGEGEWYRVRLDGRNICKKIGGFYRAVEWANNHYTARVLAPIDTDAVTNLVEAASIALHDIDDLIANSEGVAGLHMNGDVAEWESILAGGAFGAWMQSLEQLRAALAQFKGENE